MKKIFKFLIIRFKEIKYLVIVILAFLIIYGGIPGASTALALGSGLAQCHPALVGISIAIGGGFGSALSQHTGQIIFNESKLSKLEMLLKNFTEKHENYIIPVLTLASISFIPETYLFASIGKDISKIKMFFINLITRFFNFWLSSWLGKNFLVIIFKKIKEKIENLKGSK